MRIKILPSLLAADFGDLAAEFRRTAESGADELHLDIMDGSFVPNISFGPAIVKLAARRLDLPLNVHLMLTRPDLYIERFAEAGASTIQIHVESSCDIAETLQKIRGLGVSPGLVLNPRTPHTAAIPYLNLVDEVLQMTVYPGYGGQKFMPGPLPEIAKLREAAEKARPGEISIMVDGGVSRDTIGQCARAGANAFVAGTALYKADDMKAEVGLFRRLAESNRE